MPVGNHQYLEVFLRERRLSTRNVIAARSSPPVASLSGRVD